MAGDLGAAGVLHATGLGKVSIVGAGMVSNPGVAARMFEALADNGINIQVISTSEIKVSCLIDLDSVPAAVRAIHDAFALGEAPAGSRRADSLRGDQQGRRGPETDGPGGEGCRGGPSPATGRRIYTGKYTSPSVGDVHVQRGRPLGQTGHGHDVAGQADEEARAHVGPDGAHRQRPSFGRALQARADPRWSAGSWPRTRASPPRPAPRTL